MNTYLFGFNQSYYNKQKEPSIIPKYLRTYLGFANLFHIPLLMKGKNRYEVGLVVVQLRPEGLLAEYFEN